MFVFPYDRYRHILAFQWGECAITFVNLFHFNPKCSKVIQLKAPLLSLLSQLTQFSSSPPILCPTVICVSESASHFETPQSNNNHHQLNVSHFELENQAQLQFIFISFSIT